MSSRSRPNSKQNNSDPNKNLRLDITLEEEVKNRLKQFKRKYCVSSGQNNKTQSGEHPHAPTGLAINGELDNGGERIKRKYCSSGNCKRHQRARPNHSHKPSSSQISDTQLHIEQIERKYCSNLTKCQTHRIGGKIESTNQLGRSASLNSTDIDFRIDQFERKYCNPEKGHEGTKYLDESKDMKSGSCSSISLQKTCSDLISSDRTEYSYSDDSADRIDIGDNKSQDDHDSLYKGIIEVNICKNQLKELQLNHLKDNVHHEDETQSILKTNQNLEEKLHKNQNIKFNDDLHNNVNAEFHMPCQKNSYQCLKNSKSKHGYDDQKYVHIISNKMFSTDEIDDNAIVKCTCTLENESKMSIANEDRSSVNSERRYKQHMEHPQVGKYKDKYKHRYDEETCDGNKTIKDRYDELKNNKNDSRSHNSLSQESRSSGLHKCECSHKNKQAHYDKRTRNTTHDFERNPKNLEKNHRNTKSPHRSNLTNRKHTDISESSTYIEPIHTAHSQKYVQNAQCSEDFGPKQSFNSHSTNDPSSFQEKKTLCETRIIKKIIDYFDKSLCYKRANTTNDLEKKELVLYKHSDFEIVVKKSQTNFGDKKKTLLPNKSNSFRAVNVTISKVKSPPRKGTQLTSDNTSLEKNQKHTIECSKCIQNYKNTSPNSNEKSFKSNEAKEKYTNECYQRNQKEAYCSYCQGQFNQHNPNFENYIPQSSLQGQSLPTSPMEPKLSMTSCQSPLKLQKHTNQCYQQSLKEMGQHPNKYGTDSHVPADHFHGHHHNHGTSQPQNDNYSHYNLQQPMPHFHPNLQQTHSQSEVSPKAHQHGHDYNHGPTYHHYHHTHHSKIPKPQVQEAPHHHHTHYLEIPTSQEKEVSHVEHSVGRQKCQMKNKLLKGTYSNHSMSQMHDMHIQPATPHPNPQLPPTINQNNQCYHPQVHHQETPNHMNKQEIRQDTCPNGCPWQPGLLQEKNSAHDISHSHHTHNYHSHPHNTLMSPQHTHEHTNLHQAHTNQYPVQLSEHQFKLVTQDNTNLRAVSRHNLNTHQFEHIIKHINANNEQNNLLKVITKDDKKAVIVTNFPNMNREMACELCSKKEDLEKVSLKLGDFEKQVDPNEKFKVKMFFYTEDDIDAPHLTKRRKSKRCPYSDDCLRKTASACEFDKFLNELTKESNIDSGKSSKDKKKEAKEKKKKEKEEKKAQKKEKKSKEKKVKEKKEKKPKAEKNKKKKGKEEASKDVEKSLSQYRLRTCTPEGMKETIIQDIRPDDEEQHQQTNKTKEKPKTKFYKKYFKNDISNLQNKNKYIESNIDFKNIKEIAPKSLGQIVIRSKTPKRKLIKNPIKTEINNKIIEINNDSTKIQSSEDSIPRNEFDINKMIKIFEIKTQKSPINETKLIFESKNDKNMDDLIVEKPSIQKIQLVKIREANRVLNKRNTAIENIIHRQTEQKRAEVSEDNSENSFESESQSKDISEDSYASTKFPDRQEIIEMMESSCTDADSSFIDNDHVEHYSDAQIKYIEKSVHEIISRSKGKINNREVLAILVQQYNSLGSSVQLKNDYLEQLLRLIDKLLANTNKNKAIKEREQTHCSKATMPIEMNKMETLIDKALSNENNVDEFFRTKEDPETLLTKQENEFRTSLSDIIESHVNDQIKNNTTQQILKKGQSNEQLKTEFINIFTIFHNQFNHNIFKYSKTKMKSRKRVWNQNIEKLMSNKVELQWKDLEDGRNKENNGTNNSTIEVQNSGNVQHKVKTVHLISENSTRKWHEYPCILQ